MCYINLSTQDFVKILPEVCISLRVIPFTYPQFADLYNTYRPMGHHILILSDITYHEIHTSLLLSLHKIEYGC